MKVVELSDIRILRSEEILFEKVIDSVGLWPIVYILHDSENLYIGETVNLQMRLGSHRKNPLKSHLNNKIVILSDFFNKSVVLHLESYLIGLFSGDARYKLLNGNSGLIEHSYYNQAQYEELFPFIWDTLRSYKLVERSVKQIHRLNSFKYSPYKGLNADQQQAVITILEGLLEGTKNIVISGIAGTGKTILAIYLMKLLCTPIKHINKEEWADPFSSKIIDLTQSLQSNLIQSVNDVALVLPMTSLRGTLKKVFRRVENLSAKQVVSPTDVANSHYKLVIVDETHRLRQRKNLSRYTDYDHQNKILGLDKEANELDWIIKKTERRIFFYDKMQSIKPTDISEERITKLTDDKANLSINLISQIRSEGGNLYSDFILNLMRSNLRNHEKFESNHYEVLLTDNLKKLKDKIHKRDNKSGVSRLVAGFSWKWVSRTNHLLYDIKIDGLKLRWNSIKSDWINSPNAVNEVGCIHTTQGYDIDYVGIIFGNEIGYDLINNNFFVRPSEYQDRSGKITTTEEQLKTYIINIYQTLLLRGMKGTYIYCCDSGLREYFRQHIELMD